jgi:hypothetical protein
MRATHWFAAACASCGAGFAVGAEGLDLSTHGKAAVVHAEPAEAVARGAMPTVAADAFIVRPAHSERDFALATPGCRPVEFCSGMTEARLLYRGARRYMPSFDGMAAEGISLRHDRLVLRYSFR